MEALTQEFGTSQSPMDPTGLAAALAERRDAAEALHLGRVLEALTVGAEAGKYWRARKAADLQNRSALRLLLTRHLSRSIWVSSPPPCLRSWPIPS